MTSASVAIAVVGGGVKRHGGGVGNIRGQSDVPEVESNINFIVMVLDLLTCSY